MITLGIDIGGTSVKAAARRDGELLWVAQSRFYATPTAEDLRSAIRQTVAGRLTELDTVGLCVPGIFDHTTRTILKAINVPGLVGIALDQFVADALGFSMIGPAQILNDTRAAAHDIHATRKLNGRLLVLALGTGVGSAVLDDGRPLIVEDGSPGHLGQIDVSIAGHPVVGPDGGTGGLEGYVGVSALRKVYGEDFSAALGNFSGNEPPILALIRAIRICHAIYRPNHVCLCGGIGIRLRHLLPNLRQGIETGLTSLARAGWTFSTGEDDFHAARGAACLAGGDADFGV